MLCDWSGQGCGRLVTSTPSVSYKGMEGRSQLSAGLKDVEGQDLPQLRLSPGRTNGGEEMKLEVLYVAIKAYLVSP